MNEPRPTPGTPRASLTPAEARSRRASMLQAADFLDSVCDTQPDLLPEDWSTLEAMPDWVLHDTRALRRLALLTGALYAAPALRLCLDAQLLQRVSRLVGRRALDAVLDSSGLPDDDASLLGAGAAAVDPRHFFAHSAALLLAGLDNVEVRKAVARVLGVSQHAALHPVRPAASAQDMARRAHAILCASGDAAARSGQPTERVQ